MNWLYVFLAVFATFLANLVFPKGMPGKIISVPLILVAIVIGGYTMTKKGIFVRQKDIKADVNVGARVSDAPAEGAKLPPVHVEQEGIDARSNTGLDFSFNPNSGPVVLDHTVVKNEHMRAEINPNAGTVTINPSVGSVKFIHEKKGN